MSNTVLNSSAYVPSYSNRKDLGNPAKVRELSEIKEVDQKQILSTTLVDDTDTGSISVATTEEILAYFVPSYLDPVTNVASINATVVSSNAVEDLNSIFSMNSPAQIAIGLVAFTTIQQRVMVNTLGQQEDMVVVINAVIDGLQIIADALVKHIQDQIDELHSKLHKATHKKGLFGMLMSFVKIVAAAIMLSLAATTTVATGGLGAALFALTVLTSLTMLADGLTQFYYSAQMALGKGNYEDENSLGNAIVNHGIFGFAGNKLGGKLEEAFTIVTAILGAVEIGATAANGITKATLAELKTVLAEAMAEISEMVSNLSLRSVAEGISQSVIDTLKALANKFIDLINYVKTTPIEYFETTALQEVEQTALSKVMSRLKSFLMFINQATSITGMSLSMQHSDDDDYKHSGRDQALSMGIFSVMMKGILDSTPEKNNPYAKMGTELGASMVGSTWLGSGMHTGASGSDEANHFHDMLQGLRRFAQYSTAFGTISQANSSVGNVFTAMKRNESGNFSADETSYTKINEEMTELQNQLLEMIQTVYNTVKSNGQQIAQTMSDNQAEIANYLNVASN